MASESSSAVLDLNDADVSENAEPPSVMDDTIDGVPLIMERGFDIAVKVDSPLKQLSTLETFVTYRVRCVCARWQAPPYVRRRYNHFKALHKRLCSAHPLIACPPLPPLHSARQQLDRYSPSFVAIRTLALNAFLERVAKHPIMTHSEDLKVFLTANNEELEKLMRTEAPMQLWGLPRGGERPNNGSRVRDPEFVSASEYLSSFQQKLTTLCSLSEKLQKGSLELGGDLVSMKRVCDAWSSQVGGLASKGISALGTGAGIAGTARRETGHRGDTNARATLPLLAAYCAAHVEKIRQRDALHASYISGNNATGDAHNRLEQASEALRSELSDWIPKTKSEIKSILLEIADRQVGILTQTLQGWESALRMSKETNSTELFKTVSKTAVQNLSPSKYHSTETENDDLLSERDSNSSDLSKSLGNNYVMVDGRVDENYEMVDDVKLKDLGGMDGEFGDENGGSSSQTGDVSKDPLNDFADINLAS